MFIEVHFNRPKIFLLCFYDAYDINLGEKCKQIFIYVQTIAPKENCPLVMVRVRIEIWGRAIYLGGNYPCTNFIILQKQPLETLCKRGVLKNFATLTGKHLCWSLFAGLQVCNFIKMRLQH